MVRDSLLLGLLHRNHASLSETVYRFEIHYLARSYSCRSLRLHSPSDSRILERSNHHEVRAPETVRYCGHVRHVCLPPPSPASAVIWHGGYYFCIFIFLCRYCPHSFHVIARRPYARPTARHSQRNDESIRKYRLDWMFPSQLQTLVELSTSTFLSRCLYFRRVHYRFSPSAKRIPSVRASSL